MDKFRGQYRIPSARLPGWDYSRAAAYFITICTAARQHFFGQIVNNQMVLNDCGRVAADCWAGIPHHFSNAALDAFIVMPNHMHGILILDGTTVIRNTLSNTDDRRDVACNVSDAQTGNEQSSSDSSGAGDVACNEQSSSGSLGVGDVACNEQSSLDSSGVGDVACNVSTGENGSTKNSRMAAISPKPGSASAIIRSYKSAVSNRVHCFNAAFGWQSRMWDHIIRNNESYQRIRHYILTNPENWASDKFYGDANTPG